MQFKILSIFVALIPIPNMTIKEEADNCYDFKSISLDLFGKDIILIFKEGSESFDLYGKQLKGLLSGRTWGEKLLRKGSYEKFETVIAITIHLENEELTVPCKDIQSISQSLTLED